MRNEFFSNIKIQMHFDLMIDLSLTQKIITGYNEILNDFIARLVIS